MRHGLTKIIMSKTGILTLMVLFLSLHDAKGKPVSDSVMVNRNSRSFGLDFFGEPHSHRSWLVPISTFPFSNLFKVDTNDMTVLTNKVETMEENLDKILKLMTELSEAPKATSCVSPSAPTSNDHSKIEPENIVDLPSDKLNSIIIDIPNSEEETHEDTNQHQIPDSKNEVKNDDPLSIEHVEPVNSLAKLDSNENTNKEVESLLHLDTTQLEKAKGVSEKLENHSISEEESTEIKSINYLVKEINEENNEPVNEEESTEINIIDYIVKEINKENSQYTKEAA